jgi:hypothetical protein
VSPASAKALDLAELASPSTPEAARAEVLDRADAGERLAPACVA